ncbi:MAG: PAS domain-containing protein, partial [Pseudonocardia sp.]|nr:PAS domain-containing protein [Pseudonocardia sp.]
MTVEARASAVEGEGLDMVAEPTTRVWRVVIVDDSPDERAQARRLLLKGSGRRYQFVEAETAAAGLRAALGEPPDCLLLDYYLPDLDAPDVLASLAGPDGLTVCPVVVITGRAGAQLGPAVLRAGAQDYIGKDWVTPEGLTRAVENAAERWAMARELRASDERFRLAAQVAGLAVAEVDYVADRIRLSAEAAALLGMPAAAAVVPRAAVHALVHPNDRLVLSERLTASHDPAGTGAFEVDHRIVWPDGRIRWLGVRKQVFFAGGRPVRALVAMFDITSRKEAEAQLRRNNETFFALIQNNPFGVYLVDADFRLRQVSLGARKAFASVQPLLGRDFGDVLRLIWAEPFASEVERRFRHTLATGEAHTETTAMNRRADIDDVEAYDWRIERTTLPDGRFGVVCYFYDLSVRGRWEAALLAKEQELRSITDNTPDVLTRFDRDLRHVFANAAIQRATGHTPQEVIGKRNRELDMPAELADRWEAATRSVFDRGEPTSLDFTFEAPEGPRHYTARLVPEFAADGTVEFVLGVSHDVTAQRRANAGVQEGEARRRAPSAGQSRVTK